MFQVLGSLLCPVSGAVTAHTQRTVSADPVSLQIQMYQLSRLLHDYHRDLYNHLEEHEIGPSLYAAPWFLTVFASQFPLGFVARVFGKWVCTVPEPAFPCSMSLHGEASCFPACVFGKNGVLFDTKFQGWVL